MPVRLEPDDRVEVGRLMLRLTLNHNETDTDHLESGLGQRARLVQHPAVVGKGVERQDQCAGSGSAVRHGCPSRPDLRGEEALIVAAARQQVVVRTSLDDAPIGKHEDLVGLLHRREAVGDHEKRDLAV